MNDMQLFDHGEFGSMRTAEIDGTPYVVGVDVARALEYAKPSQAVIDHCKGIRKLGIPSHNQYGAEVVQETNCIPEGDIYRLIYKAAEQNRNLSIKEKAERFERWIFDEVLPAIRKHGMYVAPQTVEAMLADPDTMIRTLEALRDERAVRTALEGKVEQDAPKVLFADSVAASEQSILIGELAKILHQNGVDIGQNRLFDQLRNDGYLCLHGERRNLPTQRAMDMDLFEIRERIVNNHDGSIRLTRTTKVTGKGQIYFVNRYAGDC